MSYRDVRIECKTKTVTDAEIKSALENTYADVGIGPIFTVSPCPAAEQMAKLERMVRHYGALTIGGLDDEQIRIHDELNELWVDRPTLTEAIAAVEEP
jgi:hypothetical protein